MPHSVLSELCAGVCHTPCVRVCLSHKFVCVCLAHTFVCLCLCASWAGMDAQKISAMAEQLNIKIPSMSTELSNSIDELKKLPTLLQVGADAPRTLLQGGGGCSGWCAWKPVNARVPCAW